MKDRRGNRPDEAEGTEGEDEIGARGGGASGKAAARGFTAEADSKVGPEGAGTEEGPGRGTALGIMGRLRGGGALAGDGMAPNGICICKGSWPSRGLGCITMG